MDENRGRHQQVDGVSAPRQHLVNFGKPGQKGNMVAPYHDVVNCVNLWPNMEIGRT